MIDWPTSLALRTMCSTCGVCVLCVCVHVGVCVVWEIVREHCQV